MEEMNPEIRQILDDFCKHSNKIAPRTSDFERWENFIIRSNDLDLEVSNWVYDFLLQKGFEDDIAFDFYNQYKTARNVLKKKGL